MSKITVTTIAGATSGSDANKVKIESGDTLEVQSNATVGGNLTVDTNTLHVDSSNNKVGIGTTSPAETLEVVHATAPAIQLNRTNDGGFKSIIRQQGNDTEFRGSSGSTKIYTGAADGDSSTARLLINASGHVTKPNQPMFSISGGPNSYRDGSNNETVILHGQSGTFPGDMNIGGHFSYSNGRFTAPVAGNYMFTYTLTSGDTNAHFIELRKNNSSQTTVLLYATQYQSGCHSTIYTLAANDYITAQRRGTGYGVYSAVFSGFLIG